MNKKEFIGYIIEGERGFGMSMYHIKRTHPKVKSSEVK